MKRVKSVQLLQGATNNNTKMGIVKKLKSF